MDIKRSTDTDTLMDKLYKLTPLEDSFGCNFNILVDGKPMVLGIKGILDAWIEFRMKCIRGKLLLTLKRSQKSYIC